MLKRIWVLLVVVGEPDVSASHALGAVVRDAHDCLDEQDALRVGLPVSSRNPSVDDTGLSLTSLAVTDPAVGAVDDHRCEEGLNRPNGSQPVGDQSGDHKGILAHPRVGGSDTAVTYPRDDERSKW